MADEQLLRDSRVVGALQATWNTVSDEERKRDSRIFDTLHAAWKNAWPLVVCFTPRFGDARFHEDHTIDDEYRDVDGVVFLRVQCCDVVYNSQYRRVFADLRIIQPLQCRFSLDFGGLFTTYLVEGLIPLEAVSLPHHHLEALPVDTNPYRSWTITRKATENWQVDGHVGRTRFTDEALDLNEWSLTVRQHEALLLDCLVVYFRTPSLAKCVLDCFHP